MSDPKRLGRLLRVRAIQRDAAAADAARAADQALATLNLVNRIEALTRDVAPEPGAGTAFELAAAAMFRDRLNKSHVDARQRQTTAEALLAHHDAASREAQRDHRAIEKLSEQARSRAVRNEMRRLAEGPFGARRGMKIADTDAGR